MILPLCLAYILSCPWSNHEYNIAWINENVAWMKATPPTDVTHCMGSLVSLWACCSGPVSPSFSSATTVFSYWLSEDWLGADRNLVLRSGVNLPRGIHWGNPYIWVKTSRPISHRNSYEDYVMLHNLPWTWSSKGYWVRKSLCMSLSSLHNVYSMYRKRNDLHAIL